MKDLYKKIISLKNLTPTHKVNSLFEKLVEYVLSGKDLKLSTRQRNRLQSVCAQAEYELEKYWAERIIKSKNPQKEIKKFPYYQNYQKLTKMEWSALLSCAQHRDHKIIFVGGGPLPLTSIILAKNYGQRIRALDKDETACQLSQIVIKKLNLSGKIKITKDDGAKFNLYKNFNVIIVSALAGLNLKEKEKIFQKIKENAKPGSHILARSSFGTRTILYKPLSQRIYQMFKPILEIRPQNEVINSIVIFQT
jgi:nicotianamine synthase